MKRLLLPLILFLTIISASVVMDMQGNRFTAEVVVNAKKDFTAAAQVEDFDWKKALDAAIAKAETQVTKYLEKKQHHKNGETLAGLEAKNAEKNAQYIELTNRPGPLRRSGVSF